MSHYINRVDLREGKGYKDRETVDEFDTYEEAIKAVREYHISDPYAHYHISNQCCDNWKED